MMSTTPQSRQITYLLDIIDIIDTRDISNTLPPPPSPATEICSVIRLSQAKKETFKDACMHVECAGAKIALVLTIILKYLV